MPKPFHVPAPATPSMFLVLRWNPAVPAPAPRPRPPRPALPPAPDRVRTALKAIARLRADGLDTLADIARSLNTSGVPTLSGRGAWHGAQVARAEARIPA